MRDISEIIPFWSDLTDSQKDIVKQETRWVTFKKGTFIYSTAEECLGALFIEKGQIRTYIVSDEGREITMFRLREGDTAVLSASCVVTEIEFDICINAMEDTEALLLPSIMMEKLMKENVKVDLYFSKLINARFSEVMWTIQQILFFGVDKRIAIFLWDEMAKNGQDTIKFTHEEIAVIIGSAREVVSRILKMFQEEGIVTLGRGSIKILDKARIKSLCE